MDIERLEFKNWKYTPASAAGNVIVTPQLLWYWHHYTLKIWIYRKKMEWWPSTLWHLSY